MARPRSGVYTHAMRSRVSLNTLISSVALVAALLLTVTRPSPEGIIAFGMGEKEVRAAPGAPSASIARHNLSSLEIVNRTLIRVQQQYVDPQRISPKEMLYEALDSVQFDIPEVLVEPNKESDEVEVVVNDKRQKFSTSEDSTRMRRKKKL